MALAAGPLDVPLGPLQALSTFLPNDNSPLAAETESILKNLRGIQEQVRAPMALGVRVFMQGASAKRILPCPLTPEP